MRQWSASAAAQFTEQEKEELREGIERGFIRLGRPGSTVLSWLRTTEELFFTDRLGHWIFSPVSR